MSAWNGSTHKLTIEGGRNDMNIKWVDDRWSNGTELRTSSESDFSESKSEFSLSEFSGLESELSLSEFSGSEYTSEYSSEHSESEL